MYLSLGEGKKERNGECEKERRETRKRTWKERRIVTRDSHNLGRKKYYEESEKERGREKSEKERWAFLMGKKREWDMNGKGRKQIFVYIKYLFFCSCLRELLPDLLFKVCTIFTFAFIRTLTSTKSLKKILRFKKRIAANQQLVFLSSFLLDFFLSWTLPDLKKTATWLFNSFLMTCGWIFSQLKSWSAFIQSLHRSINISFMQQVTLPDLYASTLIRSLPVSYFHPFFFFSPSLLLLLLLFFFSIEDFSFLWTGFDHYHHHPWVRGELRKGST